jgi:endonuclease G
MMTFARRRGSIARPLAILLTIWLNVFACAGPQGGASGDRPIHPSTPQVLLTAEQTRWVGALCPFGRPLHVDGWDHAATTLIARPGYVLEHCDSDKVAVWVCEFIQAAHLEGDAARTAFKPDPALPPGARAELNDYRGSGFDRGHQAPAADFKYDAQRMRESFYLSNVAPQVGRNFNQSIWRVLEERVRDVVRRRGEAYVITGPIFAGGDDCALRRPGTTIGDNRVAVPTHFYKIVIARRDPRRRGDWKAIAFVLPNTDHPRHADRDYRFDTFTVSIDSIEQRTGINFMPMLDHDAPAMEAALEREPAAMWPEWPEWSADQ